MHPEVFTIGPITVYSYGVMLGVAFAVASALAMKEARRKGLDPNGMFDFLVITLVVALLTSRLVYVLFRLPDYLTRPWDILDIRDGAGALHGGLLGGVAVALWYARRAGTTFWRIADTLAPSLAIGTAIGRVGCLLAGCCYGTMSTVPWAVTTVLAPGWRHPAQIYESLLDLTVFAFLWWYRSRQRFDGQPFLLYVGLYSIVRFVVEFYREPILSLGPITSAQAASIALAVASFGLLAVLSRKTAPAAPTAPAPPASPPVDQV